MGKILVKYNKLPSKDPITEVIPGCVTRTRIDISRDIRKEVLLMEDGSLKTDIPELAAWKDIISLHFLGHAIAGLSSNGSIRFYVANQRMQYKSNKEEWAEIWESLLAVDNVKQLIVWGSPYGTSRSGPFAVGQNYNGKLWLAGAMAVIGITSETWSNIERLYDVWGGVLAVRKDRTLLGSGRYSALTGKRIVPEKQSGNDIWYLENNEVAYIPFGQDNAVVLENISKIIKYSMFDYAYLTCDGTVYSKHFNHFEEDEDSRKIRRNAADILAFGDEGKYLAVLYRNGEVRVFINTHSEDEAYSPLNDTYEFVTNQNYKYFSGDLICENAKSLRFEAGELKAEVNDEIAPEEIIQSSLAINGASIKEAQENASPADSSEWISYEHSNEYQKYYDRIFELIEPEIDRFENASSAYPTKPVNIVRVYTAGLSPVFDIFALTKEGRVLYFKISDLEQESEAKRREVHLRKMSEWRDIVDLAINGNYVSGLRNDGTVVTTSSYDCSKWDDIVQIVMGDWCLAGLRRDGTVIISENRGNNVTMDVKTWRNISSIAAGTCLFGLKSDGRVVRYYDGKLSDNPTEISTLSDISSIAVEDRTLYALTKDKNMITIPQREFAPIDLSQTVRIYNICSFVFAQQSSGRLEILNKDIYYKDDWADACALEKIDDVVFSVMPDGSLKANWYQDKDTRFKGGSIVLNKRLELIDKLQKTKGIARLHFQDGHNLYGEYRGVLAKIKNGSIVTLDDVFNGNTPSTDNAGNEFVIKDQNTIAILNKCSLTFKVRMEKIGEATFEYEHFTLENVQSAHLYDKDRSLFIKYNDDRYISVGRVYFSSTSTREPLAYSSMGYRIERGSTRSREINHVVYGIAGIAKDNRPILRGRDVKRYEFDYSGLWLISTFPSLNIDIDCYPAIKNHLLSFGYERLEQSGRSYIINGEKVKSRKKTNNKCFETQDSISYWDEFSKQKIIWKRIGSLIRFAYDDEGYLGLDSTCMATGDHIKFVSAFLNSIVGNHILSSSPKTGTGDLLISVQALDPIRVPLKAEKACLPIIETILEKSKTKQAFHEEEMELDTVLFDYYGFTSKERDFLRKSTKIYR